MAERDADPEMVLSFDQETGILKVVPRHEEQNTTIEIPMSAEGFFGG